jgi:hypothetical protein
MKTLTQLSATVEDLPYHEPRGILQSVHVEPQPGFFLRVELGAAGVRVRRGNAAVLLPLASLVALAQEHEPELIPPAPAPKYTKPVTPLAALLLLLGLWFFVSLGVSTASAQASYPRGGTNLDFMTLAASTTNSIGTNFIQLYKDRGLALFATVVCTNAATTNLTVRLNLTSDGTNYTTDGPLVWFIPLNGTTMVRTRTNFPAVLVDNMRRAQIATVANDHTASVYLTNIVWAITP